MKVRLVQMWQQLNERERNLLRWGGVFLGVYLSYAIYACLSEAVTENTQSFAEKKETLAWIKQAETQFQAKKTSATLDKSKGLTVLSEQLKSASFHAFPYQLQQLNEDELQLSFEKVPYNACLAWLALMSKKYGITVKELQADRTEIQGLVKLRLIVAINP